MSHGLTCVTSPGLHPVSSCVWIIDQTTGLTNGRTASIAGASTGQTGTDSAAVDRPFSSPLTSFIPRNRSLAFSASFATAQPKADLMRLMCLLITVRFAQPGSSPRGLVAAAVDRIERPASGRTISPTGEAPP